MIRLTIEQIESDIEGFLQKLQGAEPIVVVKGEAPVAEITPAGKGSRRPRPYGLAAGEFRVPDDFDDPLPDDLLDLFEGG